MSGDVQPRKRKDKKRKKEESTDQVPPQFQTPSTPPASEDINIHVHKDEGTGGGICAKIVFFFLFSALAVLIGLIITEHRGLTDLDTVDTESRFSQIFEGWIDNSVGHDDHDDHLEHSLEHDEDDHDEHGVESREVSEGDEHDEHEEEVSDGKSHADDEEDATEEDEEQEITEESVLESEEDAEQEDDEEEDESVTKYDEDEEEEQEPSDEQEEQEESEEQELEPSEEQEASEEQEISEEQEASEEAAEDDEEDAVNSDSKEPAESQEEQETVDDDDDDDADDKPEESTENDVEDQAHDDDDETPDNQEDIDNENAEDNSRMAVKIGVGVALLVVAHVVLVRKWKTASTQELPTETQGPIPDLTRRNTIVVPPSFQEVQHDIDDAGEEVYSDEEEEDEEEVEEVASEDDKPVQKSIKTKYQELRSTYSRSLTPDNEKERREQFAATEDYEEGEEVEEEEEDIEEDDDDEEEEEEEEEENDEEEDYERDEELLKRLEAKYGKMEGGHQTEPQEEFNETFFSWKRVNVHPDNEPEESDSDRQSDDVDTYEYENITNKDDWQIKEKLDEAQKTSQNNAAYAIKLFDVLLKNYPSSPRSLYGKAQALDLLADQRRSNDILQQAIATYLQVLKLEYIPDALFQAAADRCVNRMRFIGRHNQAIDVHNLLIQRFPHDPKHLNQLTITCLTANRVNKARTVLIETLRKYPEDGLALVHYGFILKTTDNNLNESVVYLKKGIKSKEPGVIDGRFYFHLGDALSRLGRNEEAMKIYEEAVHYKLFLSKYQRSLYNVPHLKPQPWWSKEETPYDGLYLALEQNWKQIRDEGLAVLSEAGRFENESENLRDTGDWKQFELFARGQKNVANCKKCPITCKIINSVPDARGCKRGQTKFSVMHPETHVWPHCGPTNCRLRIHLGLQVPPDTYIRVTDEIRSWENGKVLIFDDSFEHEVWHNGTTFRLILIVDVWHPELTANQKRSLPAI